MMEQMRNIELLAPARNVEIGIEAIRHGADAVYIGGPGFGARAAAGNSVDSIRTLCDYAHLFGARVYVTLNTIIYDDEVEEVVALVTSLYEAGVDALITQDLALLNLPIPPIALHASTQMDNRTPEKARMLEQAGFSQIVLARELSLAQIRDVHAATSLPLEAFVHGALCVSYSGKCYASQYCFDRSANRGRCAQFCRLAFDLVDAGGRVVRENQHLLSLKDMNHSADIEELLEAGVSSFKIEGRLKDAAYVKNVTAYYRKAIDKAIEHHPERYRRASQGCHTYAFTPDLQKSFNRGYTDYFLHGRKSGMWNFRTPKFVGEHVGQVARVTRQSILLRTPSASETRRALQLANGDGLAFYNNSGQLEGFRANRVDNARGEIFPHKMPNLKIGTAIYRNEDTAWEALLARPTAVRLLPLKLHLEECADGYRLTGEARGVTAAVEVAVAVEAALKPQEENIRRNLAKFGGTPFRLDSLDLGTCGTRFIPAGALADMRRRLVTELESALRARHMEHCPRRRAAGEADISHLPLDYSANVANRHARQWLEAHGAEQVAPAFELRQPDEVVLMTCRHCLRFALGHCPRQAAVKKGSAAAWDEPLSLRLPDGRLFPLRFDCRRCEMQILAPQR